MTPAIFQCRPPQPSKPASVSAQADTWPQALQRSNSLRRSPARHCSVINLVRALKSLLLLVVLLLFAPRAFGDTPPFAWIEAEDLTSANFTPNAYAAGPPGVLSGKWVQVNFDKDKAQAALANGPLTLTYTADVPQAGTYQLWARIGFEHARTPFEWQAGGTGDWHTVAPEARTTSLMRLGFFMEAAWCKLGDVTLPMGKTPLAFRVREAGKDGNILSALDCAALVKMDGRDWTPEGRLKPGEQYAGDLDKTAAAHTFALPAPTAAQRVELSLNGTWQAARYDDPNMDTAPYEPVKSLPTEADYPLKWMGVAVPSSAWNKPELAFGHRLIYRTRVQVPAQAAGRSFVLHFSGTCWIASVFVNGTFVGSHEGVLVPWDLDISKAVTPGQTNEIAVAIKGSYYAHDAKAMNGTLESTRNIPTEQNTLSWSKWVAPIYPSSKGEGNGLDYGLVNPVRLTVAGPAYVSDVFVKTSVAKKTLDADVTLNNNSNVAQNLTVTCEALNRKTGQVEQTFAPVAAALAANGEQTVTVSGAWANPKLWWPVNNADLYTLRTTVAADGKPLDVHEQTFGFHEITVDGIHIRLNGVIRNFWNWVGVSGTFNTPEEWLTQYRAEGNRFHRIAADSETTRFFPYREAMLDFFDAQGVAGRLSTCVDGMFITYDLNDPLVWKNFTEHISQVTKAYRNHPSIMMYSVENEVLYINAQNTGQIDMAEPKVLAMMQAGKVNDSTRPYMADGGGAGKDNLFDINCEHYPEGGPNNFPDNAYTFADVADHSARWPWDHKRPLVLGETFFYAGKLEDQAWIGGDRVFRGRDEANRGAARLARLLVEGFRWQGAAGICPWVAESNIPGVRSAFSDLAVFTRQQALRAYGGKPASVLVKVFNDTLSDEPVTFEWAVMLGKQQAAGATVSLALEPGTAREQTLRFTVPASAVRRDGELLLRVSQNGKVGFEDHKPIAFFPSSTSSPEATLDNRVHPKPSAVRLHVSPTHKPASQPAGSPILLYDKSGKLAAYLAARGIRTQAIASLAGTGSNTNALLIVGPDTLTPDEAASPVLLRFAASGGRVLVLEQNAPLTGSAFPTPVRATSQQGGYAYAQALGQPLFANLRADDFRDWQGGMPTFKNAYLKPPGGARSLIECGDGLNYSALLEVPCGRGVIVATQLRVGAKLGMEPAADQLFQNLIAVYSSYAPSAGTASLVADADGPLAKALSATGLRTQRAANVGAALNPTKYRVALLEATPANLAALQTSPQRGAFTQAGGWIVLHGLTRDGLPAFNKLTGVTHQLRPFRLERVTMQAQGSPLAATLGNRDLTFYSTKEISFGDYFLDNNQYSNVAIGGDGSNVAPFCTMPDGPKDPFEPYTATYSDNDPYNYVNGLLNSDNWRYIRQIGINAAGQSTPLVFGFPYPATIRQINLWNNVNYATIDKLDIVFDGDDAHPMPVTLPPTGAGQEFAVTPPRTVQTSIALVVRSSRRKPGDQNLVGLDNVQFIQQVPASPVSKILPIDNVGGLIAYPQGKGGLFLCQLKLTDEEPNPENKAKKQRLLSTLLQNMGTGSRSSDVAVPGLNVQFTPLDLTRYANRFLKAQNDRPAWFGIKDGSKSDDLSDFKLGKQYLNEVLFFVTDYNLAPVPQAILLGNSDAPNDLRGLPASVNAIPVGKRADALYFLHTALVTRPLQEWERAQGAELYKVVVHYADGTTADIPVRLEETVDNWVQNAPHPLAMARVAWSAPRNPADSKSPRNVLYSFAWNNPKPTVAITSLDIVAGKDASRGVPAVLAITVGSRVGK